MTIASDRARSETISVKSDLEVLDWDEKILVKILKNGSSARATSSNTAKDILALAAGTNPMLFGNNKTITEYDATSLVAADQVTASDSIASPEQAILEAKQEFVEIMKFYRSVRDVPTHINHTIAQHHNGTAYQSTTSVIKSVYYSEFLNVLWQIFTINSIKRFTDLKLIATTLGAGANFTLSDFKTARTGAGASNIDNVPMIKRCAYMIGMLIRGGHTGNEPLIPIYIDPTKAINVDYLQYRSFYKLANRIYGAFLTWFTTDKLAMVSALWNMFKISEADNSGKFCDLMGFKGTSVGDKDLIKNLFRDNVLSYSGTYLKITKMFTDASVSTLIDLALTELWNKLSLTHYQLFTDVSRMSYGVDVNKGGVLSLLVTDSERTSYNTAGPIDIARTLSIAVKIVDNLDKHYWRLIEEVEVLNIAKYIKEYIDPILGKFPLANIKINTFGGFVKLDDLRWSFWKQLFPLTGTTRNFNFFNATTMFWNDCKVGSLADFDNLGKGFDWVNNFGDNTKKNYNLRIIGDDMLKPQDLVLDWCEHFKYKFSSSIDDDTYRVAVGVFILYKVNGNLVSLNYKTGAAYFAECGIDDFDLDATFRQPDVTFEAKNAAYSTSYGVTQGQFTARPEKIRWPKDPFIDDNESGFKPFVFDGNPGFNAKMFRLWVKNMFYNASSNLKELVDQ